MARTKEFEPEEALERAMDLFWWRGYEATSLRDLLGCMRIGRGSFYDTFGDKRALFLATLNRYGETRASRLAETLYESSSARDAIKEVFERTLDGLVGGNRRRGCLLANSAVELAPHDPEVAAKILRYGRRDEEAFHAALVRARLSGEIPARHDPLALARFLSNGLQGLRVSAKAGAERATLEDVVRVTLSVLE